MNNAREATTKHQKRRQRLLTSWFSMMDGQGNCPQHSGVSGGDVSLDVIIFISDELLDGFLAWENREVPRQTNVRISVQTNARIGCTFGAEYHYHYGAQVEAGLARADADRRNTEHRMLCLPRPLAMSVSCVWIEQKMRQTDGTSTMVAHYEPCHWLWSDDLEKGKDLVQPLQRSKYSPSRETAQHRRLLRNWISHWSNTYTSTHSGNACNSAPDTFIELQKSITHEHNTWPNDTESLRDECTHRFTLVVAMVTLLTTLGSDSVANAVYINGLNLFNRIPVMQWSPEVVNAPIRLC